jgi:uncharacterized protein (TIGR03435 family)
MVHGEHIVATMQCSSARRRAFYIPSLMIVLMTTLVSSAQLAPLRNPAVFDVAVIRPTSALSNDRSHIWSAPNDGNYKAQNVTLKQLIQSSFAMPASRILGGPSWLGSTRFDLEAKAGPSVDAQMKALSQDDARQQKRIMQQALLADRFHLVTHLETRELPIYALVITKDGVRTLSQANGTMVDVGTGHMRIEGSDNTMAVLADQLSQIVGRVVVDKTGIQGRYLLTLKWTPDDAPPSDKPDAPPSIFTALQEQLGLKLEPQKGPVPVLVVDHADTPSDN